MADPSTTGDTLQKSGVLQNNNPTTIQEQNQSNLPSTIPSNDLQPNANGLNDLKSSQLSVKYGPAAPKNTKHANGTLLSIILVAVILIIAATLFIASLRIPEEGKPSVAPGAESAGALGESKKKRFKRNKKKNR